MVFAWILVTEWSSDFALFAIPVLVIFTVPVVLCFKHVVGAFIGRESFVSGEIDHRSPLVRAMYIVFLLGFYFLLYQEPTTWHWVLAVWLTAVFLWNSFLKE